MKIKNLQYFSTLLVFIALVFGSLYSNSSYAHAPRENYVWVNIEIDHISGRFEINKNDLKNKLNIDIEKSSNELIDEIIETAPEVQAYLERNFSLSIDGELQKIEFLQPKLINDNGRFVQYHYRINAVPQDDIVQIKNTIFLESKYLENDPLHRSLIVVEYNKFRNKEFGKESTALVFGPHLQESSLDVENPPKILIWKDFLYQGLLHIWIGLDHILFLLTLLLTVVLKRSEQGWMPESSIWQVFLNILKIITIFTISHAITLSLSVLGIVSIPIEPVEAIIAFSIVVVALNNVFNIFKSHTWILIFIFGLIHGLGFASALGDLQFRNVAIEKILIMFNVGVELGQIAIVIVVLPILFYLRTSANYRKYIMPLLSVLAAVIASFWVADRLNWW